MSDIDKAFEFIEKELRIPKIRESLEIDYDKAVKVHDSIHELMNLIGNLIPRELDYSYKENSAYILYHWEIFDLSHRSYMDALSTYYNAALTLLRSVIEFMIRGAFFECLAHKKYREKSLVIDDDEKGKKIKKLINDLINLEPNIEKDLEISSVAIYDKTEDFVLKQDNMPSFSRMLKQIIEWGILDGIEKPYDLIYDNIYKKLSMNTHGMFDATDIGRVLVSDKELFRDREILSEHLLEYFNILHEVIDICLVATMNILKENTQNSKVKDSLRERIMDAQFISFELKYTQKRIKELLEST